MTRLGGPNHPRRAGCPIGKRLVERRVPFLGCVRSLFTYPADILAQVGRLTGNVQAQDIRDAERSSPLLKSRCLCVSHRDHQVTVHYSSYLLLISPPRIEGIDVGLCLTSNNLCLERRQRLDGRSPGQVSIFHRRRCTYTTMTSVVRPHEQRVIYLVSHTGVWISTHESSPEVVGELPEHGNAHRKVEPDDHVSILK